MQSVYHQQFWRRELETSLPQRICTFSHLYHDIKGEYSLLSTYLIALMIKSLHAPSIPFPVNICRIILYLQQNFTFVSVFFSKLFCQATPTTTPLVIVALPTNVGMRI